MQIEDQPASQRFALFEPGFRPIFSVAGVSAMFSIVGISQLLRPRIDGRPGQAGKCRSGVQTALLLL